MHVLQVSPYFPPTWAYGGIPRIVDGLSRALVRRGLQVSVLTTDALDADARAPVPPRRDHEGVQVFTLRNLSNRLAWREQLFLPLGGRAALRALESVELVHLHGHRHLLNNLAVGHARRLGLPWVLTANGTLHRHERRVGAKWLWDRLIAGEIPQGAARCVAVSASDAARHQQAGIPPERIVRIPNGLDLGEFQALPPRGTFRARHGLGQRPLVAYLGQLSPRKGVEHLVEAFADGAMGEAVLVVAGAPREAAGAASTAAGTAAGGAAAGDTGGAVRFCGLLRGEERLELLADADVLVYPSTAEVFGLVPFEGLLCGAPVVVGDDCGCGELIAEAGAGLLVRHGDVAGLRARIRTLLADRVAARAMVARGRRYIGEHLDFQRVAARHEALYAEVLAERGRRA